MKEPDVHYSRIFNIVSRWDKYVDVTDDHIKKRW